MVSRFTKSVASAPPSFDFVAAHFDCERDRFSAENPQGFVNLGSAQNFMHADALQEMLMWASHGEEDETHYQRFEGTQACREAIARHLCRLTESDSENSLATDNDPAQPGRCDLGNVATQEFSASSTTHTEVHADDIVVGNGIISLLEALVFALLDEGEQVLIPTPVFPGLVNAVRMRSSFDVAFLHTDPAQGFQLRPGQLERALKDHQKAGDRIKAILLCSPGNPVGQVFNPIQLDAFEDIAKRYGCALIVDEVYAGSCFEDASFRSAVALQSERVYVLGGLSKDFGLAGYATGWLHATDQDVMKAVAKQAHFFRLPTPVQRTIQAALDPDWKEPYLANHQNVLRQRHAETRSALETLGVPVADSKAGLCVWMDLRRFLDESAADPELQLYQSMLQNHRVHISPGSGFYTPHRGFFRLCFTQNRATLREGLKRLRAAIAERSNSSSPFPIPFVEAVSS